MTRGELERTAGLLDRAFDDDPLYRHLFPDPAERRRWLPRYWQLSLAVLHRAGPIDRTDDERAVAAWIPPMVPLAVTWVMLRCGFAPFRLMTDLPEEPRRRLAGMMRRQEASKVRAGISGRTHWFLAALAVEPGFQGQGIGGRLLRAGLERADARQQPVYLYTETERNVAFYLRHGFSVAERLDYGGGELTLWTMARPAGGRVG
jgi:ribosomal protein S18 acetylase RimI-like enzyme